MSFRDGDAEAAGLADALIARKGEGARWAEMAVLYRNNFLSRAFEEALMRAKIPYRLVGDVGFYARAEIKDALALLRLAAMPDDRQSNEAFRRVINEPRRGFGAKAIEILERDATFLGDLGFERLEPFLHGLQIMTLPDAAHPGRRYRLAEFAKLVGDADLAQAGWSSETSTMIASTSGGVRFFKIGLRRVSSCSANSPPAW